METKIIYKIKRISDGKYSTGGTNPKFIEKGKHWTRLSDIKNHFNILFDRQYYCRDSDFDIFELYKNCVIEKIVVTNIVDDELDINMRIKEQLKVYKERYTWRFSDKA